MGYFFVIIASCAYGLCPIFSSLLLKNGWSVAGVILCANFLSVLILMVIIKAKGLSLKIEKKQALSLIFLGGMSYWIMEFLLHSSYNHILPGIAVMIHFIYPVIVMVFMVIAFREKITFSKILCVLLSLAGIFLILGAKGLKVDLNFVIGVFFAAASGFAYAVFIIASDKSPFGKINSIISTFYIFAVCVVLSFVWIMFSDTQPISLSVQNVLCLLGFSALTITAIICLGKGIHLIGATKSAIINMLEPAVSLTSSLIVFRDVEVTPLTFVGCAFLMLSTLIISIKKQ